MSSRTQPAPVRTTPGTAPLLSLVLCSRNDQFQGDSLWRLQTALNHVALTAARLGRLRDIEVVVTDWGSDFPLREAARLSDEAASVVRFVTVPPELAREKQRDSRFAEVIALNAAIRRSDGLYIGRIDQDTLVGRRFLEWFLRAVDGAEDPGFPLEDTVMISNRRRIPYDLAVRCPPLPVLERYLETFGRRLPLMPRPERNFWEVYVGILLMHRRLWEEARGFDERFIYYSYMEFDLVLRLLMRHPGRDIGPDVGHDFHHLDHIPEWRSWRAQRRVENPIRTPESPPPEFSPNGPDWGLRDHRLEVAPTDPRHRGLARRDAAWRPGYGRQLAGLTAISTMRTAGRVVREHVHERGPVRGLLHVALVSTGLAEGGRRMAAGVSRGRRGR